MYDKWGRQYLLTIQGKSGEAHEVSMPLTVDFSVRRNILASANTSTLRVYNLQKKVREDIDKACYELTDLRYVTFQAGYNPPLSTLAFGNIVECKSYRAEGTTNVITEISILDGSYAMATAQSAWTISPTSDVPTITKDMVIDKLMTDLTAYGIKKGKKSSFEGSHPRGISVSGNTWDTIRRESDESCFIDLGTVHVIKNSYNSNNKVVSDCLQGNILEVNSKTGLLGSPRRADLKMIAEILFEPNMIIGQRISVRSSVNSQFDGIYKVIAVEHFGTISGAVSGKCKTLITYLISGELNLI